MVSLPDGEPWPLHYGVLAASRELKGGGASVLPEGGLDTSFEANHKPPKKGDHYLVFVAIVSITKTIVGAGVLALPSALQEGGVGLGFGCLAATGVLSLGGFLAIGFVCHVTGARTFREAWQRTVGWRTETVDAMLFWETIICCVGYMLLILDYLSVGLRGAFGVSADGLRAKIAVMVTALCLIPLCLKPSFHSLRHTSLFGNVAILFTIGYVILESSLAEARPDAEELYGLLRQSRKGVLQATSLMTSAYICHYSAPVYLAEIQQHSAPWKGFCLAAAASFGLVALLYGAFAIAGFRRFAPAVQGNVLLNYDSNPFIMTSWICMGITLIVTFPLQFKIARDTVVSFLGMPASKDEASSVAWKLLVVVMVAATAAIGTTLSDISQVLAFRGALLGCPISFTMPGVMLVHLPATHSDADCRRRVAARVLIAFGIGSSVLGLSVTLGA